MRKGLILINGYTHRASELNQPQRLKAELEESGVNCEIFRNDEVLTMISQSSVKSFANGYDFCVYLDKDEYVSEMLENAGLRLFNCHKSVWLCDDKMKTCLALAGEGIPMPDTISAPLCYSPEATISPKHLEKIEGALGYPMVVKECYGSLGQGVYLAKNREELEALSERLKTTPHIYQRFVATSFGRDVRVIVIGGRAVCSMLRTSSGDFRSNIELGGCGTPYELGDAFREIAEKTAKCLKMDYCGIDILFGDDGKPIICEVNSNAFFGGIEKVTGVNVARLYAKYIIKGVYNE